MHLTHLLKQFFLHHYHFDFVLIVAKTSHHCSTERVLDWMGNFTLVTGRLGNLPSRTQGDARLTFCVLLLGVLLLSRLKGRSFSFIVLISALFRLAWLQLFDIGCARCILCYAIDQFQHGQRALVDLKFCFSIDLRSAGILQIQITELACIRTDGYTLLEPFSNHKFVCVHVCLHGTKLYCILRW